MRLQLFIAALLLGAGAGAAQAADKPAKSDDQRICVTTTTVVKRGDVVLSTSSNTRCEDDRGRPQAEAQSPPVASEGAAAPSPAARGLVGPSNLASFFGARPVGLTPRDVLGVWTALERGKENACRVQMTREAFSGGFRVLTSGCRGALAVAKAWKFDGSTAQVYAADGTLLASMTGDKEHLAGALPDGGVVDMSR